MQAMTSRYVMLVVPVSEPWRKELQEIAAAAGLTPREQPAPEPVKRKSLYSAETGRLIPPPSRMVSRGISRVGTGMITCWTHRELNEPTSVHHALYLSIHLPNVYKIQHLRQNSSKLRQAWIPCVALLGIT